MLNLLSMVGPFGFPILGLGALSVVAVGTQVRGRYHVPDLNSGLRTAMLAVGWTGSLQGAAMMFKAVLHAEPATGPIMLAMGASVTLTTTLLAVVMTALVTPGDLLAGARSAFGSRRSPRASAVGLASVVALSISGALGTWLAIEALSQIAHGSFAIERFAGATILTLALVAGVAAFLLGMGQAVLGFARRPAPVV